jgi:general secretion pathway protein H
MSVHAKHLVKPATDAGMSLIEMLVVLGILATVVAVAMPRVRISPHTSLSAFTAEVAAELRAVRALAINRNMEAAFQFDVAGRTISSAATKRRREIPRAMGAELEVARGYVREASNAAIVFFADGSSTGGTLILRESGETARIGVDWLSGRIDVVTVSP